MPDVPVFRVHVYSAVVVIISYINGPYNKKANNFEFEIGVNTCKIKGT